jgi:hypothetical protein
MGSHHFPIKIVLCLTQNLCRPPGAPNSRRARPEMLHLSGLEIWIYVDGYLGYGFWIDDDRCG